MKIYQPQFSEVNSKELIVLSEVWLECIVDILKDTIKAKINKTLCLKNPGFSDKR